MMNLLKNTSIAVLTIAFGLAHFSVQAGEMDHMDSADAAHSLPVFSIEPLKDRAADKALVSSVEWSHREFSAKPKVSIEWIEEISIELSDEELIAKTRI